MALPLERCPAQPFWRHNHWLGCVCVFWRRYRRERITLVKGLQLLEFAGAESHVVWKEEQSPPAVGGMGKGGENIQSLLEFSSFLFHKANPKIIISLAKLTPPHLVSLAQVVLQKG